jgi:hypothetical protein
MSDGLTSAQQSEYRDRGFIILRGVFDRPECDAVVEHMLALQSGRKKLEGFAERAPDNWGRTHNQHLYDAVAMGLLLDPRLHAPLRDCFADEPEGVQTMYFWKGSEQHWHQDQYYLPGCMSAWIALVDVGPDNGTIWVQPGSHKGRLVQLADLRDKYGAEFQTFDKRYDRELDDVLEHNRRTRGAEPEPAMARAGDVVLFHGALIHRGGPVGKPGSFRHVMANHYVAKHFEGWPHKGWPRIDFSGHRRVD